MLEERALPQILWGTSQKFPNPAYPSALKVMTADKARSLVKEEYGRLIKILFYGDRHKIRESGIVWQTTYGKRTATMDLSNANNRVYGTASLETFRTLKFDYLQYSKLCYDQGVTNSTPDDTYLVRMSKRMM
ncbi:hypothetical protein EDD21DRAFT_349500 [Dissophora ornata]|nr:hypothetical protein EDD21DRAFT_349500 [Dissophora ornata]